MAPIRKKVPVKIAPVNTREEDEDEDDFDDEDELAEETETVDADTAEDEDEGGVPEDTEDEAEEAEDGVEGLPQYVEPIGAPNEGFDYFATVHNDLKAAGYVRNQDDTKSLIKYFNQMMFLNAFENGKHDVDGLGTIFSDIKPAKEMTATSTFGGKTVGEKYTVDAKHFFGFKMSGKAKNKLAELSELDGWSPEEVLDLINAGSDEDEE